jgi:hypothetical protein
VSVLPLIWHSSLIHIAGMRLLKGNSKTLGHLPSRGDFFFLLRIAFSISLTFVKIRWEDYAYKHFRDLDQKAMSCLAPGQLFTGDVLITGLRCVFLSGLYYHLCSSHLPVTGVLGSFSRLIPITLLFMCSATICTKNFSEFNFHSSPVCS